MRMRGADDDDGVDVAGFDQFRGLVVRPGDVELFRHLARERAIRVGHGHEPRLRAARAQVARVDAAEASDANQSDVQAGCGHFTFSFVINSIRTLASASIGSCLIACTAFSTARRPISSGNWATEASMTPSLIALRASSTASKPTTRIDPVLPAARIASVAPRAIMSLHAKSVSISGCACSM